jgi:hypothetical protein
MSSNWILGNSIDSTKEDPAIKSDKFVGYLINLEYPRCVIAVGEVDFALETELEYEPGSGYFFQNKTQNFQMVLLEWLDDPVENAEDILSLFYSASAHYCVKLQDEVALQMEDELADPIES